MGRPLNKRYFDPVPASNGEGVASVTIEPTDRGSYTVLPTVTVSAPELPAGVTATGAVTMRALSAAVAVGGTNYLQGDILTVLGGTGTAATFTVATVDEGTGAVLTVTPLARGSYTALPTNAVNTTDNSVAGAGATLNVAYEVLTYAISDGGSGYVATPTFTFTGGTGGNNASTSAVALTTTGTNVILAHARVVGSSSVLDADIVKQTSTNEYLMNTTDGSSICTLVASNTPVEGQAYIVATDALDSTYWVLKLTAHLALLERRSDGGTGYVYASGEDAAWSFDYTLDPTGQTVQIESA